MHIEGMGNVLKKHVTPMKAIKAFCLECQGGTSYECPDIRDVPIKKYSPHKDVKGCTDDECWLHEYRTGRGTRLK